MNDSEKKLNIAMICDPIGDYKAGALVSAFRFADLLQKRGHRVIFVGAKSKQERGHHTYKGFPVYRFRSVPIPRSGGWYTAFPTVSELKKVFQNEKIDVVHIILPMSGAFVAIKAARALNIKIVSHSHSQPENLFMDVPVLLGRRFLDKSWNKYLAWLYGKAEAIIYPSEFGKDILHHLTKRDKSSVVISNGVNIERYRPMPVGDFYERFHIPQNKKNIVYVGRLFPEKSVDTLIKAVPHIISRDANAHVIIVGVGYLKPKLEALTKKLNVENHVTFLTLNDEDKIKAYNAGHVFISPSFAELEGMTVLEAMACGKPIIVPDAPMNAARFFVGGNGFLFKTGDHMDLADKTLRILGTPALQKSMGEESLRKSKDYDIQKSVSKLEKLYYSVLV